MNLIELHTYNGLCTRNEALLFHPYIYKALEGKQKERRFSLTKKKQKHKHLCIHFYFLHFRSAQAFYYDVYCCLYAEKGERKKYLHNSVVHTTTRKRKCIYTHASSIYIAQHISNMRANKLTREPNREGKKDPKSNQYIQMIRKQVCKAKNSEKRHSICHHFISLVHA